MVRSRLPDGSHAQAARGRDRLCGTVPLRRVQELHHRMPVGSPQWNPLTGKVVKCNYCMERVDQGLEPSCVTKCVTHCLHFGKASELDTTRRERFARSVAFELMNPSPVR